MKTIKAYGALLVLLPMAAWSSAPAPAVPATTPPAAVGTPPAVPGTAPILHLNTTTLGYGNVIYGQYAAQSVVLGNTGTQPLQLTSILISGNTDFTQVNKCGTTVAPGTSCALTITFAPHALGSRAGLLTVHSNAGDAQVTLGGMGCRYFSPAAARFFLTSC
jgi:hypothetical protein